MGNLLALCTNGTLVSKNDVVLQVMKVNDGKTLEFRTPIKVQDLLLDYPNCYVGIFKEATQPLPLEYKLKIGKIYYLLPLFNATMGDVVPLSSCSSPIPKPNNGAIRIKLIVPRKQIRQFLSNKMRIDARTSEIGKVTSFPSGMKTLEPVVEQSE